MTFVWHFLEACTGFIHYMFSLAYFPNLVWRNLAKNRTKEKSFTLSPMASNLKLLPVSFGVNMCETTLSHAQYVDDVWCMFSHFWSGITDEKKCNAELARTLTESDRSCLRLPKRFENCLHACSAGKHSTCCANKTDAGRKAPAFSVWSAFGELPDIRHNWTQLRKWCLKPEKT